MREREQQVSVMPNSRTFESVAGQIHFLEYGDNRLPPLLLLHGHTDCAWSWHHISTALSESHFVIVPDLRGHGDSDWSPPYSDQFLAADVLNLMDHCGFEVTSVVAHSLGSHAASFAAGCFPDRVERLALVEGFGPPRKAGAVDGEQWRQQTAQFIEIARTVPAQRSFPSIDAVLERFRKLYPNLDAATASLIVENSVRHTESGVEWKWDPQTRDWITTADPDRFEEAWEGIQCPTLAILGRDSYSRFWSKLMPPGNGYFGMDLSPVSEEIASPRVRRFRDCELEIIDDCGHMIHYEQPQKLLDVLTRFL